MLDSRVLDEIKHFFSQLDSLKSSFKPWTSKLKQMLRLDEMDNYKDESNEMINNEDIMNQYQFVSIKNYDQRQRIFFKQDKYRQKI